MHGKDAFPSRLTGTTLKVYRLLYKEGKPLGLFEVQKMVGLSSPSVARYHLDKLLNQGLVLAARLIRRLNNMRNLVTPQSHLTGRSRDTMMSKCSFV